MPGHLSELHPVNEAHTKGQFFRASFGKNPRFQIQPDKRPLSPGTSREASGVPCLNPRRGLTLLSPVCRGPCDRSLKSEVPCGSCHDPMDCSPPGSFVHGHSPDKDPGVGCHALLQRNLPHPGIKPRSPLL